MNNKSIPKVIASGYLSSLGDIPCYILENGQRVFRFRDMTFAIRGVAHGKFGNYLASEKGEKLSVAQQEIVERAQRFVIASAKTGITGLIDEATGYQNVRPANELDMKMAFF